VASAAIEPSPRPAYNGVMLDWIGRVKNGVHWIVSAGGDLLFPPRCLSCGEDLLDQDRGFPFCNACLKDFRPTVWHGCRRCGSKVPETVAPPARCMRCRKTPLRFDTVVPLGSYTGRLRKAVLRMKRPTHDALSMAVGRLLAERRRDAIVELQADLVVPIPMFWRRRFRRGINSPDVLARCLAESLGLPMPRGILKRCRSTHPQADLPPSRRFENMRGAFQVCRPGLVKDARVLLVDDILTTGATCSEAAKMLKQAGAAMVAVAVVARAEGRTRG